MTKYFEHWNITRPIFTSKPTSFVSLEFQKACVEKSEIYIESSASAIAIAAPSGRGKSSILDHLYAKLPVAKYSCLLLQPMTSIDTPHELTKRILRHLKTNVNVTSSHEANTHILAEELKKLRKQDQRLVIFIDYGAFEAELPGSIKETVLLIKMIDRLTLPVTLVLAIDESTLESSQGIADKLTHIVKIPTPDPSSVHAYTHERLLQSNLSGDTLSEKNIDLIFKYANENLDRFNSICEEIFIEASILEQRQINSQFIFTTLTQNSEGTNKGSAYHTSQTFSTVETIDTANKLSFEVATTTSEQPSPTPNHHTSRNEDTEEESLPLSILDPSADEKEIIHEEFPPEDSAEKNSHESITIAPLLPALTASQPVVNLPRFDANSQTTTAVTINEGENQEENHNKHDKHHTHEDLDKSAQEDKTVTLSLSPDPTVKKLSCSSSKRKITKNELINRGEKVIEDSITPFSQLLKDA